MDPLSDILAVTRLKGSLYFRTEFSPPWGVSVPDYRRVARFHFVAHGACWVRVEGGAEPVRLEAGDLVVVPLGRAHVLSDLPTREPAELDRVVEQAGFDGRGSLIYRGPELERANQGGSKAQTNLVCGHFEYEDDVLSRVMAQMPPAIVLRRNELGDVQWLQESLRLLAREIEDGRPGGDALVQRISEMLLIQVLRRHMELAPEGSRPLGALKDPRISRSLELIHHRSEQRWTVAGLAGEAGMSRTAFAQKFHELMGVAPLEYLTDWRLQRARRALRETTDPVRRIAYHCGYESEAAFARAFKRRLGVAPGQYRKDAQAAEPA